MFINATVGDVFLLNNGEYASIVDKDKFVENIYYLNIRGSLALLKFRADGICEYDDSICIKKKIA